MLPHCDHTCDCNEKVGFPEPHWPACRSLQPCRIAMHAEANAIIWAARRGVAIEGAAVYVTHEPCYECSKLIIQAGISRVYFCEQYGRNTGAELLAQRNVFVMRV